MKRIADEGKPVVVVPVVREPVQVRIALRVVRPDVRHMLLAIEGMYGAPSVALPVEKHLRAVSYPEC